ncbi:MAG TPA: gamma carbonic anhydrase family protein [Salinivirgaceae bacterium]|nr:gamma carbonic anhydrase family protein [Salinivirgaceae bacterium]
MAIIREVRGILPVIGDNCFLAETAVIIGDVLMGNECSVWYGAVLRGDVNSIRIGNRVNIQDGAVLHTLYQKSQIKIGDGVTVSHNVTLHGCTIESNALIGIGAVVLDHAIVGTNTIVAAGSVVLSGQILEPNSIYAGIPAKKVKEIQPGQSKEMIEKIANNYVMYASWYSTKGSMIQRIKRFFKCFC